MRSKTKFLYLINCSCIHKSMSNHKYKAFFSGKPYQFSTFFNRMGQRFFNKHMLSCFDCLSCDRVMRGNRSSYYYSIYIRVLYNLPEVRSRCYRRIQPLHMSQSILEQVRTCLNLGILQINKVSNKIRAPISTANDSYCNHFSSYLMVLVTTCPTEHNRYSSKNYFQVKHQ